MVRDYVNLPAFIAAIAAAATAVVALVQPVPAGERAAAGGDIPQ